MMPSAWFRTTVTGFAPGAMYQGQAFDQNVLTTTDGVELDLFDMAPMVGAELRPGDDILVLVAVDPYAGLMSSRAGDTRILSNRVTLVDENLTTVRAEIYEQQWGLLAYRGKIPVLIPRDRLVNLKEGATVTWPEASFLLLGWRRLS